MEQPLQVKLGDNGQVEEPTMEEKLNILAARIQDLTKALNGITSALGVQINVLEDGRVQVTVPPPTKEGLGLLARLYHEVTAIKNKLKGNHLYGPSGQPIIMKQ
jgi:hypothetical protein